MYELWILSLSWQYVPVKPSSHSQLNRPPARLRHVPCGPHTLDEIMRKPLDVLLDATATVQLSITEKRRKRTNDTLEFLRLKLQVTNQMLARVSFS